MDQLEKIESSMSKLEEMVARLELINRDIAEQLKV